MSWRNLIVGFVSCCAALFACRHSGGGGHNGSAIVFRSADGRVLTQGDLSAATGKVHYEIIGHGRVSAKAESLHQRGREAGAQGDYRSALSLFDQASSLAPEWPYPVYDKAFTYLLMNEPDQALAYYQKTIKLSPRGYFTAITAVHALSREQRGDLPVGTYRAYVSLEWMVDRDQKIEAIQKMLRMVPRFAPAWKELANYIEDDTEELNAIENGLASDPDAETKGVLEVNKALVLDRRGKHDAAIQILGELALDPQSPEDVEEIAKFSLANLIEKRNMR